MTAAAGVERDQGTGARGVSALLLATATIVAWWPLLGPGVWLALPMALLAAAIATGALPSRGTLAGNVLVATPLLWGLAVLLLTMPGALLPTELPTTVQQLGRELALAVRDGEVASGASTALVAWLLLVGIEWTAGARRAGRPGAGARAFGFVLFAGPLLLIAVTRPGAGDAAWLGAVGLVGALLWATRGRLRTALPAAALITAVALVGTLIVDVGEPWDGINRPAPGTGGSGLTALSTEQTYGPQPNTGSGRTMLEIRAQQPGLWRMQTLDAFDGMRWTAAAEPYSPLPQPAARSTLMTVRVAALDDPRAVGDGRIASLSGGGATTIGPGESVAFTRPPQRGEGYVVTAETVRPPLERLAGIDVPGAGRYPAYTSVGRLTDGADGPAIALVDRLRPEHRATAFGQTLLLAAELARGAGSQLELVQRVDRLLRGGEYRYELSVGRPGPMPLQEFLLETKEGYCQHFAGAAAMLLRMAGVPARVAVGFATGQREGDGYAVRDLDAHAWTEVYFSGVGWVPFDMTPPDAAAQLPAAVDLLGDGDASPLGAAASGDGLEPSAALLAVVIGLPIVLLLAALLIRWWQASPSLEDALVALAPAVQRKPAATLSQLQAALEGIGPRTAALAAEAEQRRFAPGPHPPQQRVRRRVWSALRSDVGLLRALRIVAFGGANTELPARSAPRAAAQRSVAPPG